MSRRSSRRVNLEGELTIVTAAEQFQRLCSALDGGRNFDVVLSGVTDLDTAGLQLLLLTRREASRRELRVTFRDASRAVTEILAVAQLNEALEPEPPEDERSVGGPPAGSTPDMLALDMLALDGSASADSARDRRAEARRVRRTAKPEE